MTSQDGLAIYILPKTYWNNGMMVPFRKAQYSIILGFKKHYPAYASDSG
jgi:hypothetical protein